MKKLLTILILFSFKASSQTVLTIQDSVTVSSNTGFIAVVSIPHSTTTTFTFKNNSITSVNTGYLLGAGDEAPGANNNKLDGQTITGNKFIWNGTDATAITHGIFLGYQINNIVKYNYCSKVPYTVVLKSGTDAGVNMDNTSGIVGYNIIKNSRIGVLCKGINNSKIYNNTFYNSLTTSIAFVYVQHNQDRTIPAASTGTQIKNNIFYSTVAKTAIQINTNADTVGLRSDYNIFYYESGSPVFYINSVQKTFAQWQALGYDTHSIVINPNFIDTVNFVPTARLDYGTNLGLTFQKGLSTDAVWGAGNPDSAYQNVTWQVGARVYDSVTVYNKYYVATTGSDGSGTGAIGSPWFTLNKAWTVVSAGDTIYMRGGTYNYTARQSLSNKSGTAAAYINIFNYPGELPVINGSGWVYGITPILIRIENVDYLYMKGIRATNLPQNAAVSCYGLILWDDVNNSIFEQMETDHIGGWGTVFAGTSSNDLFLNCDSHHNADPLSSTPYGGSDGFQSSGTGTGIAFRGCRAWNNSDDGWDFRLCTGIITIDSCWAWRNGFREDGVTPSNAGGGDGNGFKLGPPSTDQHTVHLRTVTNSLAFHNRTGGFVANEIAGGGRYVAWVYNNTAWHNADSTTYNLGFQFATPGSPTSVHILRNNAAHANQHPTNTQANYTGTTEDHNTWDGVVTVSDADFLSLDTTGVSGARQADGSLPVLNFLKLAAGSDLINAGVDVSLPFIGSAPDMGAYEYIPVSKYYFSETGSDVAAGTLAAPWQTLSKFNSVFSSTSPGDSLLFKAGDTFYGSMIISRSGSSGLPIVISRYGTGADPIITGLTTVSAWSNLGSNIWESTSAVTTLNDMNIVVVNGVNTAMGRYPNSGYLTFQSHVTNTTITSSSLNSVTTNWTGAELVIRKNNWVTNRAPITAHSGGTLTYTSPDAYNGIDGYGFYIQNDSRTLDIANEWYYNPSTKKIRVYATSSPTNVQVSTKDTLVYILYRNYITFDNLSFTGANKSAFVILSSNNVKIQNCSIDYSGANGVWGAQNFGLPSSNFVFQNSTINHTNDFAINLSTEFAGALISNNTIRNTGINAGMGGNGSYSGGTLTGVRLRGDSITVEYNVIDSTGYVGIAFFGSDIVIRNNFVTNFCTQKIDGGGIYTWFGYTGFSTYTGQKVYNNIVLNGNGSNAGTTQTGNPIVHGIYIDDGSANVEVYGNTCANNDYSGLYLHNISNCNAHDNTLYNNGIEQMLITSYNASYPTTGLAIQNNISFSKEATQKTASWESVGNDIASFGTTINNNYYARPIDDNTTIQTKINTSTTTQRTLAGWITYSGFDASSHKSPISISDVNDLRFEYNATNAPVVVPLTSNYTYIDATGAGYSGAITLPAYSSAVLIKSGVIINGLFKTRNLKFISH